MNSARRYTLTLSCPDRVGIVAAVSAFLAKHNGWIVEANHHADSESMRYFMRQEILAESLSFGIEEFRRKFAKVAKEFQMDWRVSDSAMKHRVVILVSKESHCLYDLLYRWRSGEFNFEVPCIISNHDPVQSSVGDQGIDPEKMPTAGLLDDTMRSFVEWHGIPFHYVPVKPESKAKAFDEVVRLFEHYRGDTMVLARYMQILTPEICNAYHGRIINIHHSFLPSFMGARPYHQAHVRGVKLIGATCHYVTGDLDQGPIIEQDTVRVDHGDTVEDLVRYGKDIEKAVLARGLRFHVEDRVLLDGNKTVVFR